MDYTEWRAVNGNFVVRVDNHIITQLAAYRQKQHEQPESLGLLVGLVWENAFWIKAITTPTPFDKLSRFLCIRTQKSADYNSKLLEKLNKQSNHQWHYLGEWHTHPEICPKPSQIDKENWEKLPCNLYFNQNIHLFWILSSENDANDWLNVRINNVFFELVLKNNE
ncbi:Mov34/MPN/PAD-1 family protein [Actinobacillus pleuropneumoniae]|uniref:Mov34/MPN/PAD-1 family protein n=1 Tax=Actinobacillus pleuropneumoniae TaxID=715 RepID=UPI001F3E82B1|nr:Mov34/MPN/PAD-1 family protein [Actinobacillus pleuropneumoniae]UKH18723.1 hypothetical protein D1110_06270 [Actinobacillus pleuropneumoniae]